MKNKKQYADFFTFCYKSTALFLFLIFLLEFIDTAGSINQHVLPGEERVRCIGNLQFHQWVFVSVFPFNGFFGGRRGTAQESMAVAHVLENYQPVAIGMDTFFHNSLILRLYGFCRTF